MKHSYSVIILYAFILLASGCSKDEEVNIGEKEYSFSEPISSLSEGKDCLWIGTDLGSIFSFKNGLYKQYFVDYGRVYQVVEVPSFDSIVLVGIRNAGLKMVKLKQGKAEILKNYKIRIPYKAENNYSTYDVLIKNDTIFAGTSNGLFFAPVSIPQKANEEEYLTLLHPCHQIQGYRFFSLVEKDNKIFAAGSQGLFIITQRNPPFIDSVTSRGSIFHLYQNNGILFALNSKSELFNVDKPDSTIKTFTNKPLVYFRDSLTDWALSHTNAVISDLKNTSKVYTFKHPLAIGGDNSRSRAGLVAKEDFIYIATKHSLFEIPRHINLHSSMSIISTCYDATENKVYAVTSNNDLFRINTTGDKAEFLKNTEVTKNGNIKKLLGVIGGWLFFETSEKIYKVRTNRWGNPQEVGSQIRNHKKEIYNGYISTDKRYFIVSYPDSVYRYFFEKDSASSITPAYDFYTTSISQDLSRNRNLIIGTLNYGLWYSDGTDSKLKKVFDTPKTIISVTPINDTVTAVLAPSKIYRVINRSGVYLKNDSVSVPIEASKIIYADNKLFVLSHKGGIYQYDASNLTFNNVFFKDIQFQKEGSFAFNDFLILSSGLGLAIINPNKLINLKWIPINKPTYTDRLLRGQYLLDLSGWVLLLILFIYFLMKIHKSELYKRIARKLQLTIKEREDRIQALEEKSSELELNIETGKKHFEQLQQDKEQWESIQTMILDQRWTEMNKLKVGLVELYPLSTHKSPLDFIIRRINDIQHNKETFLLSAEYWNFRAEITRQLDELKKELEALLRKEIDENKKRIKEIDNFNSAMELLTKAVHITESKSASISSYYELNLTLEKWLGEYTRLLQMTTSVNNLYKLPTNIPGTIKKELERFISYMGEIKFNLLSFEEWGPKFTSLEQNFRHLNNLCAVYRDLIWENIISDLDTMYPKPEILIVYKSYILSFNTIFSDNHLETIYRVTQFRIQLNRLKVIAEIEDLYSEVNSLTSVVKKKAESGMFDDSSTDYLKIKDIQQSFNNKVEEFYKDLPETEMKALKMIGLIKSGSLYRKLLLLQLFNYNVTNLSNTYIITGTDNEDAKDTLRDRRSELKSEKIKPNIDKIKNYRELSVVSLTIRIVAERI